MGRSGLRRRASATLLVAVLVAGLGGGPTSALGASDDPPTMVFAGEVISAPSYGHVVVFFDRRLDLNVPVPLADFTITIDGTPHTPIAGSYLLSSLLDFSDGKGSTFVRLDLPAGVTVDALSTFQVDYLPGTAPIRDLSLTPATAETETGQMADGSTFSFLAGVVDAGNATNRLTLLFVGQVDLGSIPAIGDFQVNVNGTPDGVTAVEPRVPDIGLGVVDLVLASPVRAGDNVDFTYTPGTSPFSARNGGLVLDPFSQTDVVLFIPPTSASATLPADGTLRTGDGGPPSQADPLTTAVTTPNAGTVSIDEAPTAPAPPGYTFFGEQVVISAPPASVADPLVFVFQIDATLVPTGETPSSIVVFRNGVPIANCTGPAGQAVPTPCVAERAPVGAGGIRIKVNTVAASTWNFAVVTPYVFGGFRPPVDGPPVRNLVKAGSAIPVKFTLGGNRGMTIFTAGSPGSQHVTCSSSSPIDPIEETVNAGSSSLSYDAGSDKYTYVWKTDKAWVGTCRTLILSFGDGTQRTAQFQFK